MVHRLRALKPALLVALSVGYASFCVWRTPAAPIATPDSAGYLGFEPIHTLGYPLFVALLGPRGTILAQPVIYAAAVAFFGFEALAATSSVLVASAAMIGSMLVPETTTLHASILTESLFMSGLVLFLALAVRFERQPSWRTAAGAAIVAGVTATVRRTALAWLPVLPVIVLLGWRRLPAGRTTMLAAATLPMLGIIAGERIAAHAVHGDKTTSIVGRHMLAKAAMIDAPPPRERSADPMRARLEEDLDTAYAPIRDLVRDSPARLRSILTLYYESCLQGICDREFERPLTMPEARRNDVLLSVAPERIARAPLAFAHLIAVDYGSFWAAYKLRHPDTAPALTAFIASHRPLPFERQAFALAPQDALTFQADARVRVIQPIVMAVGWVTGALAVLGLAAAVGRRGLPRALTIACIAALTAHASLLFSVLVAAGIARFIVAVWPAIVTACVFAVWSVWEWRAVPNAGPRSPTPDPR